VRGADARVVIHCTNGVAGRTPPPADLYGTVDFHGFEPPLACGRGDIARPYGIADRARMGDVAHAALDDRSDLSLALAGLRGDAAHVRYVRHSLNHQHVTLLGEIVRFELRHTVDMLARAFDRVGALGDVAHGQRRPDDGAAGNGR